MKLINFILVTAMALIGFQALAQDYSASAPCKVIKQACDNTEKIYNETQAKSKMKSKTKVQKPSSIECMKKIMAGEKYPGVSVDPGVTSACKTDLEAQLKKQSKGK